MLRHPEQRGALLELLSGCERLVLLGDLLELRHQPLRDVLAIALPVLREMGAALGSGREVVIVPGNHDHGLLRGWLGRRSLEADPPALGLETAVQWRPEEPLGVLANALEPARVAVSYPGVWLREDVYATHGHYCDRHTTVPILERLGAGLMTRVVQEPERGPARAEDYEAIFAPLYAWIDTIAESGRPQAGGGSGTVQVRAWRTLAGSERRLSLRRAGIGAAFPAVVALLNRAGMGPLRADVSGVELRRAALRAFGDVLVRLGVQAPHVIFGHTHRAGPLPGDDRSEWSAPTGERLLNTGCWVYEPGFLGNAPGQSPYRPGFCAILDGDQTPQLSNVLDGVTPPVPG